MNVFITGATGYIGSAVTSAFVNAGHEVTALVRKESDSSALVTSGVRVLPGGLEDLPDIGGVIEEHDVLIHIAQDHGEKSEELDMSAIEAFTRNFDEPRAVIYTSGVWVLGNTGETPATEDGEVNPLEMVAWRVDHEQTVLERNSKDIRTVVIRPGCVYGGRESLLASWFEAVDAGEEVQIIGDGENQWAMVHLDDLADLYLRAAEDESISGVLHATDDSNVTLTALARRLAEARGREPKVVHLPLESARESMGGFADALAVDQRVSSEKTRSLADWSPSIERIDENLERLWAEWEEAK